MPSYESNQIVIAFLRRLPAPFTPLTPQTIQSGAGKMQISCGQMTYRDQKIVITVFSRPGEKQDSLVLTVPLLPIPPSPAIDLFRLLLSWNNGATEAVHFSIDEPQNTINLVCLRPIENLDFSDFQYCVNNMVVVAQRSIFELQKQFGVARL